VLSKQLTAAMGMMMLFYPRDPSPGSYLQLRPGGALEIQFAPEPAHAVESRLIGLLRKIGYQTHAALIQRPGMGAGIHYAGALPMRTRPGRYETDADGKLGGSKRVRVVDGAWFPRLPAKNLTYTIMANALRVGQRVAREVA